MGATKRLLDEIHQRPEEDSGIPMYVSPPKTIEPIDYSLNEFEYLITNHFKGAKYIQEAILMAIDDYKEVMNSF